MIEGWGRRTPRRPRRGLLQRRLSVVVLGLGLALLVGLVTVSHWRSGRESAAAAPHVADFQLLDAETDSPIGGVAVRFDGFPAVAFGGGRFAARIPEGAIITTIYAAGYRPADPPARRDAGPVVHLVPDVIRGELRDATTGAPVVRATVRLGETGTLSDAEGRFRLDEVPASPQLTITAPGYEPTTTRVGDRVDVAIALSPRELRAAYLTFFGVADPEIRNNVLEMLDAERLNALVVDVKGDRGYLAYRSDVPLAEAIGANDIRPLPDADQFVADLKSRGIYTIARIVVFKDDLLARNGAAAGLDVAVRDATSGGVWTDLEHLGWVDPFREEVWAYNTALAKEAIRKGFDEVQFDYVRFPTDPGRETELTQARFSQTPTAESRPAAIAAFLSGARAVVNASGGAVAADIFGFVCWMEDDVGIGQHLETLATAVDYLNPMVYPSTFRGLPIEPAYEDSPAFPYETVYHSLQRAHDRVAGTGVAIRPWLQYFDDYPWASGRRYGPAELAAQRRAVADLGLPGWMWWDPTNLYRYGPAAGS